MKDVTDERYLRLEDKFDREQELAGIGSSFDDVPLEIKTAVYRSFRFYEVDDVRDLEKHYRFLSRTTRPPEAWRQWLKRRNDRDFFLDTLCTLGCNLAGADPLSSEQEGHYEHQIVDIVFQSAVDRALDCDVQYNALLSPYASYRRDYWLPNIVSLFNVHLRKIRCIREKYFEAYRVDVVDRFDRSISGAFLHYTMDPQHPPSKRVFVDALKVLDASPATTFDLEFTALPPCYRVFSKDGTYLLRGKHLHIFDAHRRGGDRKRVDTPRLDIPLPLLR